MANSYVEYTATGTGTNQLGQATFSYTLIDALNGNDIKAFGEASNGTKTELTISSRDTSAKTITLSSAPSSYAKLRVYRQTTSDALVDFVDGARLTESDLDTAYKQGLFVAQEVSEDAAGIGTTSTNNLSLSGTTTVDNLTASGTVTLPSSTNLSVTNLTASGNIIATNRPRFFVYRGSGEQILNASNLSSVAETVDFTTAIYNVGSAFDLNTEKFTAPVTGLYRFDFSLLVGFTIPSSGVNWCQIQLMKGTSTSAIADGSHKSYHEAYSGSGSAAGNVGDYHFRRVVDSAIVSLTQNETIRLTAFGSNSVNLRIHSGNLSSFSGYLIG